MFLSGQKNPWQLAIGVAVVFFFLALLLTVHRYYTFYASFDQGIFNQVFWNGTHGRFFQSSLSSSLSTNVVHSGEIPDVSYHRLGQHFTPALLLWLPLYALFPYPITLTVLQVTLVTCAGLVLYVLARVHLNPPLAAAITCSFYGANAIIGPTLSNFADNCQMPLFVFGLLLAMEKRWWPLFWFLATCIVAVRADGGVSLFGVGVYMTLSRRYPRTGLATCIFSFGYMLVATNFLMPLFSEDISRRFMLERFGQYVEGDKATTIDILWAFISKPWLVFWEILTPIDRKLGYLLAHWLPFAFVSAFERAAWAIAGFPLLAIFLQQGESPLSMNIRYAMTVVPGLCYGAILWWSGRQELFSCSLGEVLRSFIERAKAQLATSKRAKALLQTLPFIPPRPPLKGGGQRNKFFVDRGVGGMAKALLQTRKIPFRRFWTLCVCLSVVLALTSNPNRTLYFLIPDSIQPWVHISLPRQWQHSAAIYASMESIPPDASVAATTYIVPHLSGRREIVRFPSLLLRNDALEVISAEYAIADLWQLVQYQPAFKHDGEILQACITVIDRVFSSNQYGIISFTDGVILLRRGVSSNPEAAAAWLAYRSRIS
ncbi:MAG TPA: DUF2079 domain-containing protein [Oscillatoriaceae cyanobacterium M33_DOE_052]|uniref:DUF2079 domain-containing protein n=1 Tax=Planktothricoides sp. SpSt-374 TaxID=2282167 RepID=A0A7C3ZN82_9CYAN|nr:DUF2079 domain-containing protein [Oscillatoriaceae cyanobacterium M33_DOE_052]